MMEVVNNTEVNERVDLTDISVDNKQKKAVGRQSTRKVKLPWCGVVEEWRCKSVKWSGGLHVQCEGLGEEYCGGCEERVREEGKNKMGRVEERASKGLYEYKDGYGRRSVSYVKYMLNEGISREEVEEAAAKKGWVVPLEHFEEKKRSRGRPRKEVESESRKEEVACEVGVEKKKRGRPRKEKEVSSNARGEELIASLLEDAQLEKREEEEEETRVIRFNINGKEYLKSEDNVLYDNKSHEAVGIWNEKSGSIDDIPNEEE